MTCILSRPARARLLATGSLFALAVAYGSFRLGGDFLAERWIDNTPELIALHDKMSLVFFLSLSLSATLAVAAVAVTRSRRLNHALGWLAVVGFLWCARGAWLSYHNGYPSWLGDEYHLYGLLFPIPACIGAAVAGGDLASALFLKAARTLEFSYWSRASLIIGVTLAVAGPRSPLLLLGVGAFAIRAGLLTVRAPGPRDGQRH